MTNYITMFCSFPFLLGCSTCRSGGLSFLSTVGLNVPSVAWPDTQCPNMPHWWHLQLKLIWARYSSESLACSLLNPIEDSVLAGLYICSVTVVVDSVSLSHWLSVEAKPSYLTAFTQSVMISLNFTWEDAANKVATCCAESRLAFPRILNATKLYFRSIQSDIAAIWSANPDSKFLKVSNELFPYLKQLFELSVTFIQIIQRISFVPYSHDQSRCHIKWSVIIFYRFEESPYTSIDLNVQYQPVIIK